VATKIWPKWPLLNFYDSPFDIKLFQLTEITYDLIKDLLCFSFGMRLATIDSKQRRHDRTHKIGTTKALYGFSNVHGNDLK
jgi:hypothetical protein